jgi:hypothetical protein
VKLLIGSDPLSAYMSDRGHRYPAVGASITDSSAINQFLDDVGSFYSSSILEGRACRFDYRLHWATNDDYHDGRERFERYFYPARNMQVTEP